MDEVDESATGSANLWSGPGKPGPTAFLGTFSRSGQRFADLADGAVGGDAEAGGVAVRRDVHIAGGRNLMDGDEPEGVGEVCEGRRLRRGDLDDAHAAVMPAGARTTRPVAATDTRVTRARDVKPENAPISVS